MRTMKINYDSRFDTLYLTFSSSDNSYGDDSSDSIILLRDMDTEEITGLTILSFLKKYRAKTLPKRLSELDISIEALADEVRHLANSPSETGQSVLTLFKEQ